MFESRMRLPGSPLRLVRVGHRQEPDVAEPFERPQVRRDDMEAASFVDTAGPVVELGHVEEHTPWPVALACEPEAGEEELEAEAAPGQVRTQAEAVVESGGFGSK